MNDKIVNDGVIAQDDAQVFYSFLFFFFVKSLHLSFLLFLSSPLLLDYICMSTNVCTGSIAVEAT